MGNYKGRARVDFNRQIDVFRASPTEGHTNEVSILGIPTEARMTFTQIFDSGLVDVYIGGVLAIPNFPVPGGSIISNLPNGGAGGFAGEYDAEIADFALPPEIGVGIAWDVADWLTVGFDYTRIFWSQTMDEFTVKLKNGTNPDVNSLVGSDSLTVRLPLDWEDQHVFSAGLEVRPDPRLLLRAGASWANNPIPEETLQPLLPATTEWHVAGGATVHLTDHVALDAAVVWALPHVVRVDSSRIAPDLAGQKYTVEQSFYMVGFTFDW
jgi:long-subunit fatty acid transport protein